MSIEEEKNYEPPIKQERETGGKKETSSAENESAGSAYLDPDKVVSEVEAGADYARKRLKQIENARQILDLAKEYKISEASAEWLAAHVAQIETCEAARFHGRDNAGQASQAADIEITANEYRELWEEPEAAGIGLELLEKGCPGAKIEKGFGLKLPKILEIRETATEDLQAQLSQIFDLIGRERPLTEIDDGEVVSRLSDPARNPELAVQFSKIHSEIEKKLLLERAYYQPSSADWFESARHIAIIDQGKLQELHKAFLEYPGNRADLWPDGVSQLAQQARIPRHFFLGLLRSFRQEAGNRHQNEYHAHYDALCVDDVTGKEEFGRVYKNEGVAGLVRDLPLANWDWKSSSGDFFYAITPRDMYKQAKDSLPRLRRIQTVLLWCRLADDRNPVLINIGRDIAERIGTLSRCRPGKRLFQQRR